MRSTLAPAASGFLAALGIAGLWACASPRAVQHGAAPDGADVRREEPGHRGMNAPGDAMEQGQDGGGGCSHCGSEPQGKASDASDPVETCVVSGKPLGTTGKPVVLDYEGREIRLCCQGCVEKFRADPEKYMASHRPAGGSGPAPSGR